MSTGVLKVLEDRESMNKPEGSVWTGRGEGSSVVATPMGGIQEENKAS